MVFVKIVLLRIGSMVYHGPLSVLSILSFTQAVLACKLALGKRANSASRVCRFVLSNSINIQLSRQDQVDLHAHQVLSG